MVFDNPINAYPLSLLLGKEREQGIDRAWNAIDETQLAELNRLMASIPSPTGEEGQLAQP